MNRPPVTDERLDQLLRDAAATEAERVASTAAPVELVAQRLVSRQGLGAAGQSSRRSVLVFAMMLLLGLLVGGAIAFGSGLLRLPWLPEVESPAFGMACPPLDEQRLRPGQILAITFAEASGVGVKEPPLSTAVLYEDGLLISGSAARSDEGIRSADSEMRARRLSPSGSRRLREFILHSPLLEGCGFLATDGDRFGSLVVEVGDATRSVVWGPGGGVRPLTGALATAADQLEERLTDLDTWLGDEAWQDAWAPYDPSDWLLATTDVRVGEAYEWGVSEDVNAVPLAMLEAELGTQAFAGWHAWSHEIEDRSGLCALGDSAEAHRLVAALEASDSEMYNKHWWLRDGENYIAVQVTPLLPQVSSCLDVTSGQDTGGGSPRQPDGPWNRPCEVVSSSALADATDRPDDVLVTSHLGPSDLGPQFTRCSYTWEDSEAGFLPGITLFLYAQEVTRAEAKGIVDDIFGPDVAETAIGGEPAWRNACQPAATADDVACQPAIAVAMDRYLVVVVVPAMDPSLDAEHALQQIAELLVRGAET